MKFKVGDKVRVIDNNLQSYNQVGIIHEIKYQYTLIPYVIYFNDIQCNWLYDKQLEPYYSTHDILEEIICE